MALLLLFLAIVRPSPVRAGCIEEPASQWAPAGYICPPHFGEGWASRYDGTAAAMNFCTWTLRTTQGCGAVRVTSLLTGRSVIARIGEWCHCWVGVTGPNGETERLIDLTRPLVAALGLDWDAGMFRVRVEPIVMLPDTAMMGLQSRETSLYRVRHPHSPYSLPGA